MTALGSVKAQYCGTDEYVEILKSRDPGYAARLEEVKASLAHPPAFKTTGEVTYTIPVVVHVVHDNGLERIGEEQIMSQFDAAYRDFRRIPGTIGFGEGVDMNVEFQLARFDPDGNPHPGIIYVQSPLTLHNIGDPALKQLSRWPSDRYLNVWLVRDILSGGQGQVLGYAQFPGGDPSTDGLVIKHNSWGTVGTAGNTITPFGRVFTHEAGHWMALAHPFEGGCGTSSCANSGDYICDTPPTRNANYGIPSQQNSCNNDSPDLPDQTRNHMDYANDGAKDLFTAGQRQRSLFALQQWRSLIWSEANLQMTGVGPYAPPTPEFTCNNRRPCVGAPVRFTDLSMGWPQDHEWTFEGGTPATSSVPSPTVVWNQPGAYAVTLKVMNATAWSEPLVKTGYIIVSDTVYDLPIKVDFEDGVFPPRDWKILNPDSADALNNFTFFPRSGPSGFGVGTRCATVQHFRYNGYGQRDGLVSPSFNLVEGNRAQLSFNVAYSPLQSNAGGFPYLYNDTLRVEISEDCGATWKLLYAKGGTNLMTIPAPKNDEIFLVFNDKPNVWRQELVNLTPYIGKNNLQIKFETVNGFGNNLYLDDFLIETLTDTVPTDTVPTDTVPTDTVPTDTQTVRAAKTLKNFWVYPTPADAGSQIYLRIPATSPFIVEIYDLKGVLQTRKSHAPGPGDYLIADHLASGLYVVKILTEDGWASRKITVK